MGVAEAFGEGFGVGEDGFLVVDKLRGLGLFEGDGESGDGVVVGPTLVTGEDGGVDGVFEVVEFGLAFFVGAAYAFAEEDHGATGAAERFVSGGGDDVGVSEGEGMTSAATRPEMCAMSERR